MSEDLKVEYFLLRIREKLNKEKIKLWLPPYYSKDTTENNGLNSVPLEELAAKYSVDLNIDRNICLTALGELQKHALDKLHEKEVYKETGVAVIKVKLSGLNTAYKTNNNNSTCRILSLNINLSSFTSDLQKAVGEQIDLPPERIKLISNGKVLSSNATLESQGIEHGLQVMGVVLTGSASDLQEYEKHVELLERMKDDVHLLANSIQPEDETYLQVADQSGKTLQLPPEEKRALVTAMALHEKGRAALKKEEYALALIFLLEADKAFSNCNSQLLKSVDNYALLNLDIAWCYLCLKNVTQIPDAEKRLKSCESSFKYSYGPNLERLVALKGSSGNEAALLMRLHLLQGVVLFHQNKYDEARKILKEAQRELSDLKVDDDSLCSLIELGLTAAEARIALRATKGCVNSAIDFIDKKRLEREKILKREKDDKERRKLGFCKNGTQYVEPDLVAKLVAMGFTREIAIEALRHSNNEITDAINLIHQQPELLTPSPFVLPQNLDNPAFLELIRQVASMGYEPFMAKLALQNHNGDLRKAVEELISNNGIISGFDVSATVNNDGPSTSNSGGSGIFGNQLIKEKEAFDRFSKDINTDVDDHLDITLEQEEQFLVQYLSLLS